VARGRPLLDRFRRAARGAADGARVEARAAPPRRLRRALAAVALVLAGAPLAAALYQAIATARDLRVYPPPGVLLDVGGHRLHLRCVGAGEPVTVLEGGADFFSADWIWVQSSVASVTRVCAYDRAGSGFSEPGPRPRDGARVAGELHALLRAAGEPGPYVLAGHSVGGLYARVFAAAYPAEVAGVVLIDPGHPDQTSRLPPESRAAEQRDDELMERAPLLARLGVFRLMGTGHALSDGLPPLQRAEYEAIYASARHWDTLRALLEARGATYAQAAQAGHLRDLPLIVLSRSVPADATTRSFQEMHAELAALSSRGVHRIVEGATHASLLHDPEHAGQTAAAIREVVEAARARARHETTR
jgi:pimeloyl-ACP methyl ester carboxylesterase